MTAPRNTLSSLPRLVRFCLFHAGLGVVIAICLVAAVLWFDIFQLGSAIGHSQDRWIAIVTLVVSMSVTFGGAAVATAVLMEAELDDDDRFRLPRILRRK